MSAKINQKQQLFKAISALLTKLTGTKYFIKDVRELYKLYIRSSFVKSMSFDEFLLQVGSKSK